MLAATLFKGVQCAAPCAAARFRAGLDEASLGVSASALPRETLTSLSKSVDRARLIWRAKSLSLEPFAPSAAVIRDFSIFNSGASQDLIGVPFVKADACPSASLYPASHVILLLRAVQRGLGLTNSAQATKFTETGYVGRDADEAQL